MVEQSLLSSVDRRLSQSRVARALFGIEPTPVLLGPYQLVRLIGAGGMGLVYEALHPATGQPLAVKILREEGFRALQHLQREFRVLSDLDHPNLVRFHELSAEGSTPYLTMELIDGQRPVDYVLSDGVLDFARTRAMLRQLVDAVSFLHAHGVVHRDLKPSNLIITTAGRLVVLDFGLARSLAAVEYTSTSGTPRYMAPERVHGRPANEASDWYSVGAVMIEAITAARTAGESPSSPLDADEPTTRELLALCERLIATEPADRPRADELRARLGVTGEVRTAHALRVFDDSALFVGRRAELRVLRDAFTALHAGQSTIVLLHGDPGIGKTALARQFLSEQSGAQTAWVLSGRCYDSELVPYNAFDGVIRGLAQIIETLPDDRRSALAACATPELLRLFPGLRLAFVRRVPVSGRVTDASSQHMRALRVRAFTALCAILRTLTRWQPLIVHLDDLQWGDRDSADLLSHLFTSSELGRVLLIAGFRTADGPCSPCVQRLRVLNGRSTSRSLELRLGTLDAQSAAEIARALAGPRLSRQELSDLTREADGSPLFLRALLRAQGETERTGAVQLGMERLLNAALAKLSPLEHKLLELVALCGRPVGRDLLLQAAMHQNCAANAVEALHRLKQMALIRLVPGQTFECLHDRVREFVIEQLSEPSKIAGHLALAVTVSNANERDGEFLAHHYRGAGRLSAAAHYAEAAGDRALAALALDHAVRLYTLALSCHGASRPIALLVKLADAIASTGRCAEAAPLYLEAANDDQTEQAILLRTRAAQMYFQSGDRTQGGAVLSPLLRFMRLSAAPNPHRLFFWMHLRMLHVRLLSRFPWMCRRSPTRTERLNAEICFRLSQTLHTIDPPLVVQLIMYMLPVALRDESAGRRALAMAHYAATLAALRRGTRAHQDELLAHATRMACRADEPNVEQWVLFIRAIIALTRTQFAESLKCIRLASHGIDDGLVEGRWLQRELLVGECSMLLLTGCFRELAHIEPRVRELSRYNDNALQVTCIRLQLCFLWLAQGKLDKVHDELCVHRPPNQAHDMLPSHAVVLWASAHRHLFTGDSAAARAELDAHWPLLRSAGYTRFDPWASGLVLLRGTVALACLAAGEAGHHERVVQLCRKRGTEGPCSLC